MERLTTDNPKDNLENALNLFYAKDGWTWVRGYNQGMESKDISLSDFVRLIAEQHGLDMAQSKDNEEISIEMEEMLMDGTDTLEGVVALLYTAGWVCAELRAKLMAYEDTGMTPKGIRELKGLWKAVCKLYGINTVGLSTNNPLTLNQLRKMDGEPVWCVNRNGEGQWGIVRWYGEYDSDFECYTTNYGRIPGCCYGMDGMDGSDGTP